MRGANLPIRSLAEADEIWECPTRSYRSKMTSLLAICLLDTEHTVDLPTN